MIIKKKVESSLSPNVAVTSPSFGNSKLLRGELKQIFPNCFFNETGRSLSESELINFLKSADAAIIGTDPVNELMLSQVSRLKIISKFGVGLDNIDEAALIKYNIPLGWEGGVNRRSVAEMTLCFMLGLCRRIFVSGRKLKQMEWRKDGGVQLSGKTLGIVGCGNIGSDLIQLLAPFQCTLLVCDIIDKSEFCQKHNAQERSLEDLIALSDIITLHVPLTPLTIKMVDKEFFRQMKSTAYLINTCRGEVVDQNALKEALSKNIIAGAALDVFAEEPPRDRDLLVLPNLTVTPHIGGNAKEAVEAMGRSAIKHLVSFFKDYPVSKS